MQYMQHETMYIYAEGNELFRTRSALGRGYINRVEGAISFLWSWAWENKKYIMEQEIHTLKRKGVVVGKIVLPYYYGEKLKYVTKEEMLCVYTSADPGVYGLETDRGDRFGKTREDVRMSILGKEVCEMIERGDVLDTKGYRNISYNKIPLEAMENINFDNRVYLIGGCIARGQCNTYQETLVAKLQNLISDFGYTVVKAWYPHTQFDKEVLGLRLKELPIRKGDIVLFIDSEEEILLDCSKEGEIDVADIFNDPSRESWLYGADSRHLNGKGNEKLAEVIYERFLRNAILKIKEEGREKDYIQTGEILSAELRQEVLDYVDSPVC